MTAGDSLVARLVRGGRLGVVSGSRCLRGLGVARRHRRVPQRSGLLVGWQRAGSRLSAGVVGGGRRASRICGRADPEPGPGERPGVLAAEPGTRHQQRAE